VVRLNCLLSTGIEGDQFSVSMKYGQISAWVEMDTYLYPDIVIAILILRDLKGQSIETNTVVIADRTPMLFA